MRSRSRWWGIYGSLSCWKYGAVSVLPGLLKSIERLVVVPGVT